jgi:hypothetical protein
VGKSLGIPLNKDCCPFNFLKFYKEKIGGLFGGSPHKIVTSQGLNFTKGKKISFLKLLLFKP